MNPKQIQDVRRIRLGRGNRGEMTSPNRINGRAVRPIPVRRPKHQIAPIIKEFFFFTGGVGDIFAVESFLTKEMRESVKTILYATLKLKPIEELFRALPNYSSLQYHVPIWNDFSDFWCFYSLHECYSFLQTKQVQPRLPIGNVLDLSIFPTFDRVRRGVLSYTGSSFLEHRIAEIVNFGLPSGYITICPYSSDKRISERDYTATDWEETIFILRKMGRKGVVINHGPENIPDAPELISLSNKATICEAVEILKASSGYIGIDSFLSVLAVKLFEAPYLIIKSRNDHCHHYADCYFAPRTDFGFLVKNIKC